MPYFKRKPKIIEAHQYDGTPESIPEEFWNNKKTPMRFNFAKQLIIKTLESEEQNEFVVSKNSWIVQGILGELYAVEPEIFVELYEEVKKI